MDLEFKGSIGDIYKMEASQFGVPFIICDGNDTIAHIYPTKNDIENENKIECEANANLYVVAPELLNLCLLVYNSFGGGNVITFSDNDIEQFKTTLEKALK